MWNTDEMEQRIESALPCDFVHIDSDDGVHFRGIVVSAAFSGMTRVKQHQAVYACLQEGLASGDLHALQLDTYTPEKWAEARKELGI